MRDGDHVWNVHAKVCCRAQAASRILHLFTLYTCIHLANESTKSGWHVCSVYSVYSCTRYTTGTTAQ